MGRIWIILLLVMAAGGCSVGPEIVTPDVAMAWSWIEPTVSSSAPPVVAWWTTLDDPTLTSYVERAVARNHDIRIAVARVREAKALRRATAGGHYPDIAAGGGAARLRGSENGFGPGPALVREGFGSLEDNLFNLELDASWEIDVFGATRSAVDAASARLDAAIENRREVQLMVVSEVALSYIGVRGAQQRFLIAEDNVRIQTETLEFVDDQRATGFASALVSEKLRGKHEQENKILTARLATAEKECDEGRVEASKLEGQIEELHRRLERSNEVAEGGQERHEQEIVKFENTLTEERKQADATRQELYAQLTEQRTQHARALEELEKKLLEERATATSELEKKHRAQSDEVVGGWKRSLAEARDAHEKELSTLRSRLGAMERAETAARESLKRASEESTAKLQDLEKRYEEKTSSLVKKHDAERAELLATAASTLESKEEAFEELTEKIQRARKNLEVERRDSQKTQERYEDELSSLRETQAKNLEHAEQDKMTALAELSRKSKEARTKALEIERARLQETADEVQKQHEEEVAALEERQRAALKDSDAAHESALAQKAHDLDQMSAKHRDDLADARREYKKTLAKLSRQSEEAQTKALELERRRARDTAVEVQKKNEEEVAALKQRRRAGLTHKARDLDQMSAKHREELEDARREYSNGLAERDRAAQALNKAIERTKADDSERELLRGKHAESLAALRKELDALGHTHRITLAQRAETATKMLQEVEAERDEARRAANDIRAQLAESQKKYQTERQQLEQREGEYSAELKRLRAAIAREQQESRFTRQAARISDAMQDRHEREISELDARRAHDAKRAEKTLMKKLEHLEKTLNQKAKNAAADREREWTARLERMRREYETSNAALRKEIEHKVGVAGHRSEDASGELAELKAKLEELSQELRKARKEVGLRDELIAATVRKTNSR